jgi:hypothetical protein
MTDALDFAILVVLLVLFGLSMKFVVLVRQLDQTKVAKYCESPPSVTLKKGSLTDKVPTGTTRAQQALFSTVKTFIDVAPPEDTEIKFTLNC